jgi:N-methylhydantoinase A
MPLRFDLAESAVGKLGAGLGMELDRCARGILDVANAIMAGAIRAVTVERGRDPRDFTLVAYGGAGPLHATELARELGIPRVLIPAGPGTYGAFGMLVTDIRHDVARTVHARLKELAEADLTSLFSALEEEASAYVATQLAAGVSGRPKYTRRLDLRYVGQFHPLTLPLPDGNVDPAAIGPLFHSAHLERYGHNAPGEPIEVTALRVTALLELPKPEMQSARSEDGRREASVGRRHAMLDRSWQSCAVYRRSDLSQALTIAGPAVVEDTDTNIVIGLNDRAEVMSGGHILVTVGGAA